MKILINIVAFIAFIAQFFFFVFSALNQKKPEGLIESLYNYFVFLALLCSLITIAVFVVQYNFNCQLLRKKIPNCIIFMIAVLGIYIHISQLLSFNDFLIISCVLLLFDSYIIHKVLRNLLSKSNASM